ncbi:MAG: GbsR/MarR family transcriptional regulator [Flavobacterium sp.]
MSDSQKEKEELIEMFGINFETHHNLPPLGSRLLATLILDGCRCGITFEDLVERLGASKSSVSTNLNLLQKIGKITYYTLPGDRKKYFKPAPFSERMGNYMKMIQFEKDIIERLLCYRGSTITCDEEQINYENVQAYQQHVLEIEILMQKTIEKFKEIEQKKNSINQPNNNNQ